MAEWEAVYIQRSMGVIASLFVILIIPELWKNRTFQCMEIEASSYYSLRQVYAARMLLFGMAMVIVMLWKPRGFVGSREPTAFLLERKAVSSSFTKEGHG